MEIRTIERLYRHPDGQGLITFDPASKSLMVSNEDAEQMTIMFITPYGLLQIAEAMARIAREMLYEGDEK